jgi:hypothetical protein
LLIAEQNIAFLELAYGRPTREAAEGGIRARLKA